MLAADALSEYRQAGKGVRFDERKLEKRKNDLQESQDQLTRLEEEMSEFRVSIREINEEVQRIIFPEEEDFLSGETVADLQRVQRRVQGFIEGVERRQYLAGSALKIFRDIELQERRKVESLFGKGSAVSTLFAAITGGAYPEVTFDGQQSLIRVRREDGTILPPEWLSSGTYDQLYFTIRIALGEKLLGRERGFFILDDPFLKSDRARLRSQMKVLLEVARQGWQILFFSAKDEVREALQKSIDEGEVKLQPMPQLAYRRG